MIELSWVCPVCGHRNVEDMTEPPRIEGVTPCCGVSTGPGGVTPILESS